jgi:uncharacterized repeat protein (TIGR03803 family)
MRCKKPFSAGKSIFAIFITLLLASAIGPTQAQARKFKVLHTFHGPDGASPFGELVRDQAGNLYGTTGGGGNGTCYRGYTCGTAFKLDKSGKQVWLHSFNLRNGMQPLAGLLRDAEGNLYGTTALGGDTTCYKLGCGTVFKLDRNGKEKEKLLYRFTGTPDGFFPVAPLIQDTAGNFYGTTEEGGNSGGLGTVFKIDGNGGETVLYNFSGRTDGCGPHGGLIQDSAGNFYGTAEQGGTSGFCVGYGVVFKVDSVGRQTVLYSFRGGTDGAYPVGRLLLDAAGNLYGTTYQGGNGGCSVGQGCGTVFKLDASGHETVLYRFTGGADGEFPASGLVSDKAGNLYGTTTFGGALRNCNGDACGVVFKLSTTGKETVLYSFTGGSDGTEPKELLRDAQGNLYGVATGGGDISCFPPDGCGVVFKLTP